MNSIFFDKKMTKKKSEESKNHEKFGATFLTETDLPIVKICFVLLTVVIFHCFVTVMLTLTPITKRCSHYFNINGE